MSETQVTINQFGTVVIRVGDAESAAAAAANSASAAAQSASDAENFSISSSNFADAAQAAANTSQGHATAAETAAMSSNNFVQQLSVTATDSAPGSPASASFDYQAIRMDFTIPRGEAGPQGPQGEPGPWGLPPVALEDVLTVGQTRTLDFSQSNLFTVRALESFNVVATGPADAVIRGYLFIFNDGPSGAPFVTVFLNGEQGLNVAGEQTKIQEFLWDSQKALLYSDQALPIGDLRPVAWVGP